MALKKEDIEALTVDPAVKLDLLSLFSDIQERQTALDGMRAKLPTDSQTVVEKIDHQKFTKATDELAALKKKMEGMVDKEAPREEADSFRTDFWNFFA